MTREKDAVAWHNFAGLKYNITHNNAVDIDHLLFAITDDLDDAFFSLLIEHLELLLLLPVVQ